MAKINVIGINGVGKDTVCDKAREALESKGIKASKTSET